jgi:GNAT superfamily N-acetyltransferase
MAAGDHLSDKQFVSQLKMDVNKHEGVIVAYHPVESMVGELSWYEPHGTIGSVEVDPNHRRRGVATAMLRHAEKVRGKPLIHSQDRTEEGDAWAHAVGGHVPPRREVTLGAWARKF